MSTKPQGVSGCFPAEALVHTPNGLRRIELLAHGDLVLAYDEKKKKVVPRKVTAILKNWTTLLVKLRIAGEVIWATKIHPFYLPDEDKWAPACDLRAGMRLLDKNLQPRLIEDAQHMATQEDTYNITIDEMHTFFVGEVGVLVHNESIYESTTKTDQLLHNSC